MNLEESCTLWGAKKAGGKAAGAEEAESGGGECGGELPDAGSMFGGISKPKGKVKACDLDTDDEQPTSPFSSSTDPVDRKTSVAADFASASSDCEVPEFWLDMCSDINTSVSKGHLDLRRNPERWTGYNGSKVWAAIYEENCFSKGGVSDMCYEVRQFAFCIPFEGVLTISHCGDPLQERVLYRMLSGMHASINIHIALHFYPPSKAAKRTNWAPNAARYDELFAEHPDRLKNLHFAFVVTLRAIRKASKFLNDYDYSVGQVLSTLILLNALKR